MKILIVDDSQKWIMWHESALKEIFKTGLKIETADCAKKGLKN